MLMPMMVIMIMPVVMIVMVIMIMPVMMIVPMMMYPLAWARAARIFTEHQRFDRDGHSAGRQPDLAEIDIVEIPQFGAVDHQEIISDADLVDHDPAERHGDIAIEHDVERKTGGNALSETIA